MRKGKPMSTCAAAAALALLCAGLSPAAPLQSGDLLGGHRIRGVFISPDGRHLAMIAADRDSTSVEVIDRSRSSAPRTVFRSDSRQRFKPLWCHWAHESRLLCGIQGVANLQGRPLPVTRLLGVDADGRNLRQLTGTFREITAQGQDDVIDWTPDDRDGVLIEMDENGDGYPTVFRLDINNGQLRVDTPQRPPIRIFATDGRGQVRLGWGSEGTRISYLSRLDNDREWQLLSQAEAYSAADVFKPIAAIAGTNFIYASRDHDGFNALWKVDLTEHEGPQLIYRHPGSDLGDTLFSPQGALVGVRYQEARPGAHYTDPRVAQLMAAVNAQRPDHVNRVADMSGDASLVIIVSESDLQPPQFFLCQLRDGQLSMELLGNLQPNVDIARLTPMLPISYAARDATRIPGYLTLPKISAGKPPLVVMPHGGPYSRDNWGYDSMVQFLASRGYAVLQVNFRGSTGQGTNWFKAGFQDWGGQPFDDVIDGVRWATTSGEVDPHRVCIVGASYGGYLSLMAATREPGLFRCAVSIAGVSDLPELQNQRQRLVNGAIANLGLGNDRERLIDTSPRNNAAALSIPLLMIHGERDYTVEATQTRLMAAALRSAGKPFEVVYLPQADHQFRDYDSMRTLLDSLDRFLKEKL